jgi:hypothetical protein
VRDELWRMALEKSREGGALQIWSDRTPQGYSYRRHGKCSREMVDFEGTALVRIPADDEPHETAQSESPAL